LFPVTEEEHRSTLLYFHPRPAMFLLAARDRSSVIFSDGQVVIESSSPACSEVCDPRSGLYGVIETISSGLRKAPRKAPSD